jgi:hypothetical protein
MLLDTDWVHPRSSDRHQTESSPREGISTKEQTSQALPSRKRLKEGHLRLVRILPGSTGRLVHCETRIVPASASLEYIAVSYAWGPPIAEHEITIDGRKHMLAQNLWQFLSTWTTHLDEQERRYQKNVSDLPLTAEEHYALQTHRGTLTSRRWSPPSLSRSIAEKLPEGYIQWLWVDAISIDQSDTQERMHQVRIMSRIFGGASKVVLWLGLATKEVDDLMHWFCRGMPTRSLDELREHESGISDMCGRSYWTRLWVFQELKSAKVITLMCGPRTLEWDDFGKILTSGNSIVSPKPTSRSTLEGSDGARLKVSQHVELGAATRMLALCSDATPSSLWLLLQVTSHLDCYDPRDKIYTLLSMAKTGCEGIDADYELPLSMLMHRVLSNLHATQRPQSAREVGIHCARLKALMGLEPDFPWGADEYIAAMREDLC